MNKNNVETCPEGKEWNPLTKRCNKKCKDGEKRDENFKCIKTKKGKSPNLPAKNDTEPCPVGKEKNPNTGRCVNNCKEGMVRVRDENFKCVKINKGKPGRPSNLHAKKVTSQKKSISPEKDVISKESSRKSSSSSIQSIITDKSSSQDKEFSLYYPDLDDPEFTSKISNNKEFLIHKIPKFPIINNVKDFDEVSNKFCLKFDKMLYQHFVSQYISYRTPYKSVLLYHGVGVGKTCSAVTISEALLSSQTSSEAMIWVIMPQALSINFKNEVFKIDDFDIFENLSNQCTDQNYIKLLNIYKSTFNKDNKDIKEYRETLKTELKAILKSRYEIFTYDRFVKHIKEKYSNKIVENKVIIIDEAHNIRSTNKKEKATYTTLEKCLKTGINNRLILLSATPMYNEPRDILELLKLLIINDKRVNIINDNKKFFNNNKNFNIEDINVVNLLKKLSNTYISYLKGKNPFTFALKLKPSISGIKVLKNAPIKDPSNKNISSENLKWFKEIDDDIVISKLGEAQKILIDKLENISIGDNDDIDDEDNEDGDEKHNNNMKLLQPMNIVYDTDIGSKGFSNFFKKTKKSDPIELNYFEKYKDALMPDEEHLGKYSGKFLNICNFIRKSNGIIVIYSRFLLSGIIPMAICLEHLGYTREGTNNILKSANIIKDAPKYEGIRNPKYCILTSDKKEYMGNTKIDDLIKIINSDSNYNGSQIKVILITPVASEGLSFFNTREIHLIEPWYHFNRSDQIIGRGIRNCKHNRLNIEKRNVSVFMHASINDDEERESIDINAFRISTRKYIESKKIDKIIMDNAVDCYLMKNINYFPKDIFKLDRVNIETSQGAHINYQFGDEELNEPKCNVNIDGDKDVKIDTRGFRSEIYKHLLVSIKNNIRNIINNMEDTNNNIYIDFEMLKNNIGFKIENDILMYTVKNIIYPNTFIPNKYIIRYKNGLLINPIENDREHKIIRYNNDMLIKTIEDVDSKKSNKDISNKSDGLKIDENKKAIHKVINKLDIDYNDANKTTISLYLKINASEFKILIGYILNSYPSTIIDDFDKKIQFICECLYDQGILIKGQDIPSYADNNNEYIGYINMFNENSEDDNTYIQYNEKDKKISKKYKNNTEYLKHIDNKQIISIKKNIKLLNMKTNNEHNVGPSSIYIKEYFSNRINDNNYIPNDMTNEKTVWGIVVRSKNKYILKIFTIGEGKKTGRVCETFTYEDHTLFINQLSSTKPTGAAKTIKMKNNKLLCNYIANSLINKNKLILFPLYKPKL